MNLITAKGKDKTHKLCPRCLELKPANEFYRAVAAYDGLSSYCRGCVLRYMQTYKITTGGKQYYRLHKRPFPIDGKCEICYMKPNKFCYHHWGDNNRSLGIWVCSSCDYFMEGVDEIDKNHFKVDNYRRLKKEIEETEKAFVYSGPYSPPNGIYRLFLNGRQTHKWCPRCGQMKQVNNFQKRSANYVGLDYWCKECKQTSRLDGDGGKSYSLHKRPNPGYCELCGDNKIHLTYHHWDGANASKGVWVCYTNKCHYLAGAVDLIGSGSLLPGKYSELKQEIVLVGVN